MRDITVYDDKRGEIITYVSTYDMQGQSVKGKLRPNEVAKSPRLYTEHTNSYHKTILTRTFLYVGIPLVGASVSGLVGE